MHFVVVNPGQYGSCSFFGPPTGAGGTDTDTFTWRFYSISDDKIYDLRADLSNWTNYLGTREFYRVYLEELLLTPSPTQTPGATPSPSNTLTPTPRNSATLTPSSSHTPTPGTTPTPSPYDSGLRMVIAGNDYDGDGRADPAVWNYRTGEWYIELSSFNARERGYSETVGGPSWPDYRGCPEGIHSGCPGKSGCKDKHNPHPRKLVLSDKSAEVIYFGREGDIPASGDYDGDDVTEPAIYRPVTGLWAVRGLTRLYFGYSGDCSVPGDYNGDGTIDPAIFRPGSGLWAAQAITRVYFGGSGDIPIPGDYNGDGINDPAIFRPSINLWAIRGITRRYFGASGDSPVPADYDGDEIADIGIFREESGLWAIRDITRIYFGKVEDRPQPLDFSGEGYDSIAIYRPATGLWAIRGSTRIYWGGPNYIPVSW